MTRERRVLKEEHVARLPRSHLVALRGVTNPTTIIDELAIFAELVIEAHRSVGLDDGLR